MGTSLIGLLPQNTYSGLIKVGNNTALNTTLKTLSDGAGNDLPMQASTTGINFTGTVSGVASGVAGAIQFSNGSAFASDAANLFWDDTNNRLGVGTNAPSATGHFKGSGSTSATTSLLVQNSAGTETVKATDDGTVVIGTNGNSILRVRRADSILMYSAGGNDLHLGNGTTNYLSITGNGNVHIKNSSGTINSSAQLDVESTTRGFLPPRMTTTQKNAIATPAAGLEMYDSTAKSPAYYDGTNWGYTGGALQNASGNSGTLNISFAAGNIVNLTLNATTTLAFSNAVIGTYIIQVTQGATGANLLTYPASVKWAGGTAPTLTTTVGKTDILTFYYDGTFYYGNYSLNY